MIMGEQMFLKIILWIFRILILDLHFSNESIILTAMCANGALMLDFDLFCHLMKQVIRDDSLGMDTHTNHVLHFVKVQRLQIGT